MKKNFVGKCRLGITGFRYQMRPKYRHLSSDENGTVAILAAIMIPVLIGGMGLGTEAGLWYYKQRELQHAADTAAHGAGIRKLSGADQTNMEAVALDLATRAGYDAHIGTILVNNPPTSGANAGDANFVEVVLSNSQPRLFSSIYSKTPVQLNARAVSIISAGSDACVLALAPQLSAALKVSGAANVELENCDAASNSIAADSFDMNGAADFGTGCVYAVGESHTTSGLDLTVCDDVHENASVTPDPYADVTEPAIFGACSPRLHANPHSVTTIRPTDNHPSGVKSRRYCNGMHITGKIHFNPGLYIIDGGDFSVNASAEITGTGVTFFFTNGAAAKLNGSAKMDLSAPTTGPFSGILFFGDRSDAAVNQIINGGSNSTLTGAIYFAAGNIDYTGGSGSSGGCTQIIGYTVEFSGNSDVGSSCDAAGTSDIKVGRFVRVVE